MERRVFLRTALGALVSSFALGCTPRQLDRQTASPATKPPSAEAGKPAPPPTKQSLVEIERPLIPRQRLIWVVEQLPLSSIKAGCEATILPILKRQAPFNLNLGGIDIRFHEISVIEEAPDAGTFMSAGYTVRSRIVGPRYTTTEPASIKVPAIGYLRPAEVPQLPQDSILSDGTPAINLNFRNGVIFSPGFAPEISVAVVNDPRPNVNKQLELIKDFAYLKEATSMYLDLSRMALTIRKMLAYSSPLPTHTRVLDSSGQIVEMELMSQVFGELINADGRWTAMLDIGGYILALKAAAHTDIIREVLTTTSIDKKAVEKSLSTDLGDSSDDHVVKVQQAILQNPEFGQFVHIGNLNKMP